MDLGTQRQLAAIAVHSAGDMNHEQAAALEAREALLALEAEAANGAGEVVGHQRKAKPGGLGAKELAGM